MKKKTIKIPSLNEFIEVYIGNYEDCNKILSKWCDYDIDGSSALTLELIRDCVWKCVIVFDKDQLKDSIIWHEALHASFKVLNCKGIETDYDHQESIAYLQGYIAGEIIKWIK